MRVVPVLVHGAQMPSAEELPPALADLARRNALELSEARWNYDVDRLASTAERVLAGPPAAPPPTDAPVRMTCARVPRQADQDATGGWQSQRPCSRPSLG